MSCAISASRKHRRLFSTVDSANVRYTQKQQWEMAKVKFYEVFWNVPKRVIFTRRKILEITSLYILITTNEKRQSLIVWLHEAF